MTDELAATLAEGFRGRRVLVTGSTGFKGSWLCSSLLHVGAEVVGYSLPPPTAPALFDVLGLGRRMRQITGDVRDLERLRDVIRVERPSYVFHLAAQAIVRTSYEAPIETIDTNVMGTAKLLEAIRVQKHACAVVVVTSDKCYESGARADGYREHDALGGYDPYSMSKGAAELVVASYRRSFFPSHALADHGVALASARAGNVIGGGDWARDRIVPDVVRSLAEGRRPVMRNPGSIRPWQHVLEPVCAYLMLGARLGGVRTSSPGSFCEAWNFGPDLDATRTVADLADRLVAALGGGGWDPAAAQDGPHEAGVLRLSIEKASARLGWQPRWSFEEAVTRTAEWYRAHAAGVGGEALAALLDRQLDDYVAARP